MNLALSFARAMQKKLSRIIVRNSNHSNVCSSVDVAMTPTISSARAMH